MIEMSVNVNAIGVAKEGIEDEAPVYTMRLVGVIITLLTVIINSKSAVES